MGNSASSNHIKTIYLCDELLNRMKENVQNFNFTQRTKDLIELGLSTEKAIETEITIGTRDERFAQRINGLIQLGLKAEKDKENSVSLRSSIEFLLKMYNTKNPNNPINVNQL